ncbi:alpha/beta hydrolase [Patescibacteria group bacterium]|nr:alpha/beta hydrolase [Patescibacteria group bacterium]
MNKQQILHIHGGSCFNTYGDFLDQLKLWDFNIDGMKHRNRWSHNHELFLNMDTYELIRPRMPNKENAKYLEWKIWFEKSFEFLRNDIVLIGHSLGGIFLAKYLSENDFPVTIKQIHFVGSVYDLANKGKSQSDFNLTNFPGKLLEKSIPEIHIYHSKDDEIVPFEESERYHEQIPGSQLHVFEDRGHFLDEDFPELFDQITKKV